MGDFKTVIDQQGRNVSQLIDRLEQVRDRFQANAEAQLRDRHLPFLSSDITTSDDINRYYQQFKREVDQELVRFSDFVRAKEKEAQSLNDWSNRKVGEIAFDIFNFVRQPFEPISQEKVERIIERRGKSAPAETYLQDLRDDSVPFWNYTAARLGSGADLESVSVIGVENMSNTIFSELVLRGETLTTTRDPHQLTVLNTKHGLPLFALQQIDQWQRKYENHMSRNLSPLHLFPNLPWLQDIEQGKQYFALGEVFGFITKKGVWYYVKRKDARLDDKQLAQGLEPSVDRFLNDAEMVEEITQMIQEKIAKMGNEQAAVLIWDYERRPRSPGAQAKIELDLQLSAGKFREEMGYKEANVLAAKTKLGQQINP
jgi:hypothetical protein